MCTHVGREPGGDQQGSGSGDLRDVTTGAHDGDVGDVCGDVAPCGSRKGQTGWTCLCLFRAAEDDVEGVKFPTKSPAIPPGAAPSRAAVAHSSRMARRPARGSGSGVTSISSLVPAVGWQVRADIVERERILRGWTRAQLTEAAAIDPKTLRDLLSGRRHPTLGTVGTLCRALGVPIADLIAIIEPPRQAVAVPRVDGAAQHSTQAVLPLE